MADASIDRTERIARTPPGQSRTDKWPVLHTGEVPHIDLARWRFRLFGCVEQERSLSWDEFMALPNGDRVADFHCVTRWSRLDLRWEGVPAREVVALAQITPSARFALVHAYGGYTANLPIEALLDEDVLFAHRADGAPLDPEHGGPLRLVVPKRYGWKSAKWVNGLEFVDQNQPGFWEKLGYHLDGDPWREERYW